MLQKKTYYGALYKRKSIPIDSIVFTSKANMSVKYTSFLLVLLVALAIGEAQYRPNSRLTQTRKSARQQTPHTVYGPPQNSTTTSEVETTTEPQAEQISSVNGNVKNQKLQANQEQGVYYVYHPSGLLQRVEYLRKDDTENKEFLAQLKYQDVAPIREPIYTYDPNTYVFSQLSV
ncbi:uncharacterized protein LOC126264784 [Aethina tumida]|uniref:uncharacterized protein LOC126264784 n=1 Tax=Aethina tumida TaxID=116153 RepID=UPI002148CF79|nr:uncharacterized protein LOC126264784 [Aethina tumida]